MARMTRTDRYTDVAIALHWTVAALVLLNLIIGIGHEYLPEAVHGPVIAVHISIGLTVLALALFRLAWRLTHKPPPLPPTLRRWEVGLAHAVHWLFYLLIIALPLSGWAMVSAGSRKFPIDVFGLIPVPFLPIMQDKALSETIFQRHALLGYVAIAMIVLHVAGATKHHFIDRDNTVWRMLPWLRRRVPAD